jgi:hypothetical protein
MTKSYESWNSLNEAKLSSGKQVVTKKRGLMNDQVIKWKVQSKTEFKYSIKNLDDLITNDNLTTTGATHIVRILNSQSGFVGHIGNLDATFFSKNVIVYKIRRDSKRIQTLQCTIVSKSTPETKGLDPKAQFISEKSLEALAAKNSVITQVPLTLTKMADADPVNKDDLGGDADKDEAVGTLKDYIGKSFKYTMRTNGKTYTMTVTDKGGLEANLPGGGTPIGAISLIDEKVIMWYTDQDKNGSTSKEKLFVDGPITNKTDYNYLLKIFTDEAFRKGEFNDDSVGLFDIESIKKVLYYEGGELIFADELGIAANSVGKKGASGNSVDPDVNYGAKWDQKLRANRANV